MKNKKKKDDAHVHPELEGFKVEIDSFGELKTNIDIEKINEFLNKNLKDKKLEEREDYKQIKKKGKFTDT